MLRKQGIQAEFSHNISQNDFTGNIGYTAPYDESGSNIGPLSDNGSETSDMSNQNDDADMEECQGFTQVN